MKPNWDAIIIGLLLVCGLYLYTLPFQNDPLPYGDVDSSTHFTLADTMGQSDSPLVELSAQFRNTYYLEANDGKLWYFPQYHTLGAMMQSLSGSRFTGVYLIFALMSVLTPLGVFALVRTLYGTLPAALSAGWVLLSMRDALWYVLGVFPQVAAFGLVPLYLLFLHQYATSFLAEKRKPAFAILAALMVACMLFTHPQALLAAGLTTIIYLALFISTTKKTPIGLKETAIGIGVLALLIVPFLQFFAPESAGTLAFHPERLGALFQWYGVPETGMGPDYYSFGAMHHATWLIIPLLIGIIILTLGRKPQDLLLLSWLAAFYLCTHIGILGLSRSLRFMEFEAHVIYPIIVLGVLRAPGLLPIARDQRHLARLALAAALALFIITAAIPPAHETLKGAFPQPIQRITPPEVELTEWMRAQPEDASFYLIGPVTLTKQKWIRVISLRETHTAFNQYQLDPSWKNYTYVIFDYTDLAILAQNGQGAAQGGMLQQDEQATFNQSQLAYQNAAIVVYHAK